MTDLRLRKGMLVTAVLLSQGATLLSGLNAQTVQNTTVVGQDPQLVRRSAPDADTLENRVQVDVVVTGQGGEPVPGLDASSFIVLDNRTPAKLLSFSAVNGAATKTSEVILLVDDLNATFEEASYARQQTSRYLKENGGHLKYPTWLAVLSSDGLRIQPHPTSDGNAIAAELSAAVATATRNGAIGGQGDEDRFQSSLRALSSIAGNEATVQGRKLLIWIGPGWPALTRAGYDSSVLSKKRDFSVIMNLTNQLRKSRMSIYNVMLKRSEGAALSGPNFTTLTPMSSAEAPGAQRGGPSPAIRRGASDWRGYLKGVRSFHDAESGNLALQVLAVQSGGTVSNPGNDIAEQITRCVQDLTAFYTLSILPAQARHQEEYHELRIELTEPHFTARTTAGFYK